MSLDVYLKAPFESTPVETEDRIYVRRDGETVQISGEEWDELYPDRDPVIVTVDDSYEEPLYQANITHNMDRMAGEVGLYEPLWRPDEVGITRANKLIGPLRDGLARLVDEHDRLQEFNPSNGWGNYDLLVGFTAGYLAACERWPEAEVGVWR